VALALLLLLPLCGGCLKANLYELLVYDRDTDAFRYLQVYRNIAGESADDLDHLISLWNRREQIIVRPEISIYGSRTALLRIDAAHYRQINLNSRDAKEEPAVETSISLDAIKVRPGRFFHSKDDTLGYYQEVVVSGRVADQAISAFSKDYFRGDFVEIVDREIKRRADGGVAGSWDELRREISSHSTAAKKSDAREKADKKAAPAAEKSAGSSKSVGLPCDGTSLAMLRKAAAAGEINLVRHGSEVDLALPMSPEDCRQGKATIDLVNQGLMADFQADRGNSAPPPTAMLRARVDDGGKLVITADILMCENLAKSEYTEAMPDPALKGNYRDAIAALREHGIPIDEKLTAKEVVDEFAGKRR